MGCFGYSRGASKENSSLDIEEDSVKTDSLAKKNKRKPWISWPRLQTKKSAAKTVPVDISVSENLDPISQSHSFKQDKKCNVSFKKHRHPIGVNAINTYKKRLGSVKEIILEGRDIDHLNSLAKEDKYNKKSSSRKKSTPPENTNPSATTRVDLATSLPAQTKVKLGTRENSNDSIVSDHVKTESKETNLDSIIGLSVILIVILVLMLFFGKMYAILCTSAWCYVIPRLRTAVDSNVVVNNNGQDSNVPDLNSDEHKKKVVLEGLLQRNQRKIPRL